MKTLTIAQDNGKISFSASGYLYLNGKRFEDMVIAALPPGLEEYRDYASDISISISIHEPSELAIVTTGYDLHVPPIETESEEE